MSNSILKNNMFLLFILLSATSCSSIETLKIHEINKCLNVNEKIEIVSQCIKKFPEYASNDSLKGKHIGVSSVADYCNDSNFMNCSHKNIFNKLHVGKQDIKDPGTNEKTGESEVILNPYKLFYSKAGNLGGQFILLYVFYDQETKKVIGWINRGSALHKYNFKINTIPEKQNES